MRLPHLPPLLLCLPILSYISAISVLGNRLATIGDPKQLANLCMLGRLHKSQPGPEPQLARGPCAGYAASSCCTAEVGNKLGTDDEFAQASFRLDHCGNRLSAACEKWFERSRCLYECSPNLGPWLVKVSGYSWRTERAYGVPLCQSQCRAWFAACSEDKSCAANWSHGFRWIPAVNSTGYVNACPGNRLAMCRPIAQLHSGLAERFCETVWDGEFRVVPDSQPCFRLDWSPSDANPNSGVAREASRQKLAAFSSDSSALVPASLTVAVALFVAYFLV